MKRMFCAFAVGLMLINTPFGKTGGVASTFLCVAYIMGNIRE